jgi:Resolvase, N terminal domain
MACCPSTIRNLLNTLDTIPKKGAGFKSLADAWADKTTPHGRLMLTVLGGLAESERELIRARAGEGQARAKARGVHVGRPGCVDAAPTSGSSPAARQRRDAHGHRPHLRRQPHHDFPAIEGVGLGGWTNREARAAGFVSPRHSPPHNYELTCPSKPRAEFQFPMAT